MPGVERCSQTQEGALPSAGYDVSMSLTHLYVLAHADHDGVSRHLLREVDAAQLVRLRALVKHVEETGDAEALKELHISFRDPEPVVLRTDWSDGTSPELNAALERTTSNFVSTFITPALAQELLDQEELLVLLHSSRAFADEHGIGWDATDLSNLSIRATGPTRSDLTCGLLALAPAPQVEGLLGDLATESPLRLLDVLENGVQVVGAEPRDVRPWASATVLATLLAEEDRQLRERAILLASHLGIEAPRRSLRR